MVYRYAFEDNNSDFLPNTDFYDILNLYFEDQALKSSLFDILLLIEMSIRSHLISSIGNGDLIFNAIEKLKNSKSTYWWEITDTAGKKILELKRYSSTHVHYYINKNSNSIVPSWIALESFTFGDLRKLIKSLPDANHQKKIMSLLIKNISIKFDDYLDLLAKLNDLRNVIAHGENLILKYKFTNVNHDIIKAIIQTQKFKDYVNITNSLLSTLNKKLSNTQLKNRQSKIKACCTNLSNEFPELYPVHRVANFYNETRAIDTFYPYYLIINFFITTLDLESFHPNLKTNIITFDNHMKKNHKYLGIKANWLRN